MGESEVSRQEAILGSPILTSTEAGLLSDASFLSDHSLGEKWCSAEVLGAKGKWDSLSFLPSSHFLYDLHI